MENSTIAKFLERNINCTATHQPLPFFGEFEAAGLAPHPTFIVTCLDPRCVPEYFLNLKPTDGVIVCRNVGGHIEPALKDILALDSFVGLESIMVIHHTDCGTTHFTDEMIQEILKKRLPEQEGINSMKFGSIKDIGLEQSVKDDLGLLRDSPLVRKELAEAATGYVYDIKTGGLTPVKA